MMEAIRSYLTAVVAVSMIAVLASALSHGSRMERVVRFAAGLLALLVCVTLTEEEYPQPWSATLTGTLDPEQVRALSEFLSQSLGIPTERQTWKTYG